MTNSILLTDLSFPQIQVLVTSLGAPAYRAKQLQHWIYRRLASSFEEMTELPKQFREALAMQTRLNGISKINEAISRDGTVKVLFALHDEKTIESAYMPYPAINGNARSTLCVSSGGLPGTVPVLCNGSAGLCKKSDPGRDYRPGPVFCPPFA